MQRLSAGILSAAAVAGLVGSTAAYAKVAGHEPGGLARPAAHQGAGTSMPQPATRARWAPCVKPARLEHRMCVTHVVRTVVVPDPATPTASGSPAARPRSARPSSAKPSGSPTRRPSTSPTRSPSPSPTGTPGGGGTGGPGPVEPGDDGPGGR